MNFLPGEEACAESNETPVPHFTDRECDNVLFGQGHFTLGDGDECAAVAEL
jgi:hypothetical protein